MGVACVVKWGGFMDDVFVGVKQAHLAVNRWALFKLREFGVTPARFELIRNIYERNFRWVQSELRKELGVSRATISRMIRSLVKLGWIAREANRYDRRTFDCVLTYEGRRVVASVMSALIWPKVIARIVDAALHTKDVDGERKAVAWLVRRLVVAFAYFRTPAFAGAG